MTSLQVKGYRLNSDFQTIYFDNGSEIYGASEQDLETGEWIDNRAIMWLLKHFGVWEDD